MLTLKALGTYIYNKAGSIMPMAAVMMPLTLGMVGVGVDVSMWMMHKRDLQTAADAASIAAGWELVYDLDNNAEAAAIKEAMNNGYDPDSDGSLNITIGQNNAGEATVMVELSQQDQLYFSAMLFKGDVYTSARAMAALTEPPGDFCFLSLDPEVDGAVSAGGNVEIDSAGCGIAINSNSDSALDAWGSVFINIGSLEIVGDMDIGNNVDLEYENLNTGASPIPDPYSDLEIPDYDECSNAQVNAGPTRINSDATLSPGTYCGGIRITGNNDVEFEPGVYFIDGGDFDVTGGGSLYGEGVTFILTNSGNGDYGNLDISGGKDIAFSAPEEGEDMEGLVFYQDREAPESNQCNSLTGTSAIELQGAAYFPSRCMEFGGNSDASSALEAPCTRIIAKTLEFHGNPSIGNNCSGTAVRDIGLYSVRLVL